MATLLSAKGCVADRDAELAEGEGEAVVSTRRTAAMVQPVASGPTKLHSETEEVHVE